MSAFTPAGSGGAPTTPGGVSSPVVARVPLTAAITEYSYVLPDGCRQFQMKLDGPGQLQIAYVSGDSGTSYITVPRYCFYSESDLKLIGAVTLYFQSNLASQVAEIITWV